MDGLKCACKQQLQNVQKEHPLVAPEPSPTFAATMSGLQCALAFLQDKCEKKDHLIAAITDELRLRAESCVFERVLQNVAAEKNGQVPSFNRMAVSNALPKPDTVQVYYHTFIRIFTHVHPLTFTIVFTIQKKTYQFSRLNEKYANACNYCFINLFLNFFILLYAISYVYIQRHNKKHITELYITQTKIKRYKYR